jgi:hypothetical protein
MAMAEEIPHAYAYLANLVGLVMASATLLMGKNWYRRTPLDLAGRMRCVALATAALAWLLMTLVDDLNLSPSTVLVRDGVLAVIYCALTIVILTGDQMARRFQKARQRRSESARRSPPGE